MRSKYSSKFLKQTAGADGARKKQSAFSSFQNCENKSHTLDQAIPSDSLRKCEHYRQEFSKLHKSNSNLNKKNSIQKINSISNKKKNSNKIQKKNQIK